MRSTGTTVLFLWPKHLKLEDELTYKGHRYHQRLFSNTDLSPRTHPCANGLWHTLFFFSDLGLSNFMLLFQSFWSLGSNLLCPQGWLEPQSPDSAYYWDYRCVLTVLLQELGSLSLETVLKFSLNLSQFWMLSWTSANGILFLSFTFISVTYLKVFILGKNFTEIKQALIK